MKKLTMIFMLLVAMMLSANGLKASGIDPVKSDGKTSATPENIKDNGEPEPDVFWFFIRMRIDSKRNDIEIMSGASKTSIGSLKAFSKAVWWGIQHRQVTIGPFYSEEEAANARIYYKKSRDKINELPQATAPSQMHWFQVSFIELKRLGSYEYTHSPAAVSSGSSDQFADALFEGLSFKRLSIGPFWDYTRAEEAKAIYRLNE